MNGLTNAGSVGGGEGVPSGVICMWSGSSTEIPFGWALCDGSNNTPDLRGRFIVGAGATYDVGNTGGAENVTLTVEQMPSHAHGGSVSIGQSGTHRHDPVLANDSSNYFRAFARDAVQNTASGGSSDSNAISDSGAHTHTATLSIDNNGGGKAHENRPPYYALCYIMKQ